jgi:hypothetical protein
MTVQEFKNRAGGTMWTVRFVKRTTGEERTMNARFGVTRHLKGGQLAYDPATKGLLGCYDVKGRHEGADGGSEPGYKMINLDAIIDLKFRGHLWTWDGKNFVRTG